MTTTGPDNLSVAASFALARKTSDPKFRDFIRELTGQQDVRTVNVSFGVVMPDQTIDAIFRRVTAADLPVVVAMPDETRPFGFQFLVVSAVDAGGQ